MSDGIELLSGRHVEASKCTFQGNGIPYLTGPDDFLGSSINATKFVVEADVLCEPGDILVTVKGSGTGRAIRADRKYCISRQLMAVRSKKWDVGFIEHVLKMYEGHYSTAATGLIPGISRVDILDTPVLVPPLHEQRKIAAILSTWDRAIELTEKLLAAKQKRKQALMQQFLTGKVRLPGFGKDQWKPHRLGDVASNSARRIGNAGERNLVYSVTNSVGMVPMNDGTIGENIDRYKVVGNRDFAYNPMRLNVGSISMWEDDREVLVSPDYVVFRCTKNLDPDFLNHFRKTHYWRHYVNRAGGGSVRVRIYFKDLAPMPLLLPGRKEQKAIARVLNCQDRELELLQRRAAALKQQKKGLMQQLLTGKVRVKPAKEDA